MKAKRDELQRSIINFCLYYQSELLAEGVADPKQVLATKIPSWLHLSEAQSDFVVDEAKRNPTGEMLESIELLLLKMQKEQSYDDDTVRLILQSVSYLKELNGCGKQVND